MNNLSKLSLRGDLVRNFALTFLFFTLIFAITSCKKPNILKEDEVIQPVTISEAKLFFEKEILGSSKMNSTSSATNSISKYAVWDNASMKSISIGQAVVIPMKWEGEAYVDVNEKEGMGISLNKLSYLMIYKDNINKMHAEWVTARPDSSWIAGNRSKFTGEIFVANWKGDPIKAYHYDSNGFIQSTLNYKKSSKNNSVSDNTELFCIVFHYSINTCNNTSSTKGNNKISGIVTRGCIYRWTDISCYGNTGTSMEGYGTEGSGPGGGDYPPTDCDPNATTTSFTKNNFKVSVLPPCGDYTPVPTDGSNLITQYYQPAFVETFSDLLAEEEVNIYASFGLTGQEIIDFSKAVFNSHQSEIIANFEKIESYNAGTLSDDDPWLASWIAYLKKMLGIQAPVNAQEALQLANERAGWQYIGQKIEDLHQANRAMFGIIPGYLTLDDIMMGNYSSAAINASFDLFGAELFRGIIGTSYSIGSKYFVRVAELSAKYPNIANYLKECFVKEINIIKRSNTNKVILIGERMNERVGPSQSIFKKIFKSEIETFEPSPEATTELAEKIQDLIRTEGRDRLTKAEYRLTKMFRENVDWMIEKIDGGYNVIDIGPKNPGTFNSAAYEMERSFIYHP